MCSFDLQKRIDEFKARVDLFYRDSLSKELLKKFEEHFKNVLLSETKPEDELLARAARIQFVGFLVEQTDNKASTGKTYRLLLSKEDRAFARASMFKLSGCYEWNNILTYGKCVPDNVEITKINKNDLIELQQIIVYSRGKETTLGYNMPTLSIEQIMAQIPDDIVSKVAAFSLQLEDKYPLDNYNQVMGMYGFRVVLYRSLVD